MTVKLRVLGWASKGLRCPNYKVSFEKDNGGIYPINLIQMPNGTGKTTTLTLLRTALSGTADIEDWSPEKVRSYQKKNSNNSSGEFQVRFKVNNQRVTITLFFDFADGNINYFTTKGAGKESGFNPPRECYDFFNTDFIKFFIFDGELATKLLDPDYTNAERAIEYLYKLKHFKSIEKTVKEYWREVANNADATEKQGKTLRENKVNTLRNRIKKLEEEYNENKKELKEVKSKLNTLNYKYEDKLQQRDYYEGEYNQKKQEHERAKRAVEEKTLRLLRLIRSPHYLSKYFAKDVLELKKHLDKAKLPENTAKEFFEELAEEPDCVCGRPLDDKHRKRIRKRSKNYLSTKETGILNIIKTQISDQVGNNPEQSEEEFKKELNEYNEFIDERNKAKTDLEAVRDNITSGDSKLEKVKNEIEDLKSWRDNLIESIAKYENDDDSLPDEKTFGIEILKKRLEKAEERLAAITKTLEIKKKTSILADLLTSAKEIAQKDITNDIKKEANKRIKNILPNNDILISKIDRALYLEGQEAGSKGETLSVAYAFLATIFNNNKRQLPFIVDSPANALDLKVRKKIAKQIPKLTEQFIAFTISSEREGFVSSLESVSNEAIQYITLFRKGDKELEQQASKYNNVNYTDDGIYVNNRDFFDYFHKDSEEEE